MSPLIEVLTVADVVQVASGVAQAHRDGGPGCRQCTDGGCTMRTWAAEILEQHRTNLDALRERVASW
ncbi:hypothetical protein AB0K20_03160 [Micromonospora matsumotoense]|uniref:hypothetical protein n=1 Tax=Micromonospora matsumotoense TaxID=121616 RepID=UPI0034127BE8